ncbi:MAG: hypothetical protein U9P11_05950, partial [Pseudomonadota bacterium]|nr:hypothetical protein [Pseudomonadota bacterium]
GARLADGADLAHLAEHVVDDASPAVRQVLPGALGAAPAALVMQILPRLLGEDPEPAVRAAALLVIPDLMGRQELLTPLRQGIVQVLGNEQDYFFSVYENSLQDLGLFLAGMTAWFVGRHLYLSAVIRNTRRSIPLVIGGWGTRGKSGTERIKAALFNALGHSVVSKTSGCEAMFLHAHPGGKLREMFLFRPYDKATIWEQVDVLRISRQLGTHVFLWECMGLTPSYVAILQQQWVKDDLSTITNTYPDHEDLQGPAGINIPEVMTNFIPRDATLITSEEQMAPILRDAAARRNTEFHTIDWLEAGLLTPDLLERFPYAEHPYNIALVLKMGEELGIDADFSIKEMADRVVPDLGVLKASPPASVQGRILEFINGMSANERFGCLGNYERMDFSQQDPYQEPGIWLSSVVNNRADRVARSRVFSSILVNDVSIDRHFLIGTNLDGLLNYIREDWAGFAESLTLWPQTGAAQPLEMLERAARRMRIPFCEEHLTGRLLAMLQGLGVNAELGMSGGSGHGVMSMLLVHVEAFLDAGDAIKRRKKANQIYRDLAAERISHERAALELQALTKRQKGGWLQHRLGEILYPLRAGERSVEP